MGHALPEGDAPHPRGYLPAGTIAHPETPLSAYVHVPFCSVRCGYCDFNTYTADELRGLKREDYAASVLGEMDIAREVLGQAGPQRPLETVFFGGGTPTLLPVQDLGRMLSGLRERWDFVPGSEVTVEANPDTLDAGVARDLARQGVTRVSLGMQSAVSHVLATLDRTHDPARIPEVVSWIRDAGLDVSVDLIYGTPGETLDDWRASIEAVLALEVRHVSAYALIVEDGTAMARKISRGEVSPVDDDLQADMYELADEMFAAAGLTWYELSNWAASPSDRSRHNTAYWRNDDWWGFGPGAHSHIGGVRFWNVKHPAAYARRLAEGLSPAHACEAPDSEARELESVMLGIRLADGLPAHGFPADVVRQLAQEGLINDEAVLSGRLSLTRVGRLRADEVTRRLTSR